LDTSVLLNLNRGQALGRAIDQRFGLRAGFHRHIVWIVSHGELQALAARNLWGDQRRGVLMAALQELVTVNLDSSALVDAYVLVEEACRKASGGERKMGQNDMWIAATALYASQPLITTDKDFDHLDGRLIGVHWVDPRVIVQ
jgi:tRNA(fMet)-specific endonuclease VapC